MIMDDERVSRAGMVPAKTENIFFCCKEEAGFFFGNTFSS
jgi:hypothetical protein